jgi:hypothetical protein
MSHLEPEVIIDYVHHALSTELDATAFSHIQECTSCHTLYQEEIAILDALQMQANAEEREFPESLRLSILSAVQTKTAPSLADRVAGWLRPALYSGAALAAAVVVAIVPHHFAQTPHANLMASAFFSSHDAATAETPLADHTGAPSIEAAAFVADDGSDTTTTSAN